MNQLNPGKPPILASLKNTNFNIGAQNLPLNTISEAADNFSHKTMNKRNSAQNLQLKL